MRATLFARPPLIRQAVKQALALCIYIARDTQMNLLIATIEHTGTFALQRELGHAAGRPGPQWWPLIDEPHQMATHVVLPGDCFHAHFYPKNIDAICVYAAGAPTILTTRPAAELEDSWRRRGRNMAKLAEQRACFDRVLPLKPRIIELSRHAPTRLVDPGRDWPGWIWPL